MSIVVDMGPLTRRVLVVAVAFLVGWSAHWRLTLPEEIQLVSVPAKRLAGGGLQLESRIDPKAKPAQAVPMGSKPQHVGRFKVQPRALAGAAAAEGGELPNARDGATDGPVAACSCEPITIDYTLLRDQRGQEFMRVSSPDGVVTEGQDSIVAGLKLEPDRSWAAGIGRGPGGRIGVRVDKDLKIAPLRIGVDLQLGEGREAGLWGWAVWRF